jgi:ribosome-binding factor A
VSVYAEHEKQAAVIVHLQSQRQEMRRLLADRIVMKYIPTLEFIIDDSAERAQHIEELLKSRDRRK